MPTCCKFTDRKTNEPICLIKLDEILCEILKITPDAQRMCWLYDSICITGFAILQRSNGSTVTKEAFDSYMKEKVEEFDDQNRELLERFLVTDYEFEAWYARR